MTNTGSYAARELEILIKSSTDPGNRPIVEPFVNEIIALAEKFGESGQSGGSGPYAAAAIAQAIKSVLLQKPICPITGIDEEWNDVADMNGGIPLYQNNRCAAMFKQGKDGQPYYLDAIVWKEENGSAFTGSALLKHGPAYVEVLSRQYIKSFPFTPKTFYIDVISKERAKDDWDHFIKDEQQLDAVYKYFLKP